MVAAEAAGRSVDDHARTLIVEGLESEDGTEDFRIAEEADQSGVSHSVGEAMAFFRAALHAKVKTAR